MSKLPALLVTVSLSLVACGGGQARPLPPEEPMDKSGDSSSASTSTSSATASATPTSGADDSAADPSAALLAGGAGAPTAATPDPSTAPDPKGKGKGGKGKGGGGGKGGELSAAECDQISDHEMDVVVTSMGLDPSMKEMLKQQAAGNPNLAGMKSECLKNGTRAQYKCMMAAQSKAEMGKCDGK